MSGKDIEVVDQRNESAKRPRNRNAARGNNRSSQRMKESGKGAGGRPGNRSRGVGGGRSKKDGGVGGDRKGIFGRRGGSKSRDKSNGRSNPYGGDVYSDFYGKQPKSSEKNPFKNLKMFGEYPFGMQDPYPDYYGRQFSQSAKAKSRGGGRRGRKGKGGEDDDENGVNGTPLTTGEYPAGYPQYPYGWYGRYPHHDPFYYRRHFTFPYWDAWRNTETTKIYHYIRCYEPGKGKKKKKKEKRESSESDHREFVARVLGGMVTKGKHSPTQRVLDPEHDMLDKLMDDVEKEITTQKAMNQLLTNKVNQRSLGFMVSNSAEFRPPEPPARLVPKHRSTKFVAFDPGYAVRHHPRPEGGLTRRPLPPIGSIPFENNDSVRYHKEL